jgi:hypothetical protein
MKRAYNEDISAGADLLSNIDSLAGGLPISTFVKYAAIKGGTSLTNKYTGLDSSKNYHDKEISKKTLSDIESSIKNIDKTKKRDINSKFLHLTQSMYGGNPEIYFKYIILEYMLIRILKEKNIEYINEDNIVKTSDFDLFDISKSKVNDLWSKLNNNRLNLLIQKTSFNNNSYPQTNSISLKYDEKQIKEILGILNGDLTLNLFISSINTIFFTSDISSSKGVTPAQIINLYNLISPLRGKFTFKNS